ncbi:UNVERIFIED_CONTAM: hypothetical protein FKN15_077607 [Acipenser sinensis]
MNTRCLPKRVLSAARFFTLCRLTVQPPQSYSVGGQRISGQLTGKPAGARPDYRGRWCAVRNRTSHYNLSASGASVVAIDNKIEQAMAISKTKALREVALGQGRGLCWALPVAYLPNVGEDI